MVGMSLHKFRDKYKKISRTVAESKDKEVVDRENATASGAINRYEADQEAKEIRQGKGLGVLITVTPTETDVEEEKKKKSQGLGAVITGSDATLG
jgi:hypothetical protein